MSASQPHPQYPVARKSDQVDTYHGVSVADPYRWLEEPDSAETRDWVAAENKVTSAYLRGIPQRAAFRKRVEAMWDYEKYGVPYQRGGRYFITRNDGLQSQAVLYVMDGLHGAPRVLLDPNTLSQDGTVAVDSYSVSDDGKRLAYSLAASGSDWVEWKVRDISSGKDLSDHLTWSKFSGAAWAHDGSGFYYNRYAEPEAGKQLEQANYNQMVYFHRIGTAQDADSLVYQRPDHKEWMFGAGVTDDGRYLVMSVAKDTGARNAVFVKDLKSADAPFTELLPDFDAQYSLIGNDGTLFWFQTNGDAPRGKVIAIDIAKPARDQWKTVIAELREPLTSVSLVHRTFVAHYLKDARSVIRRFDVSGTYLGEIPLPGLGTASGFGGRQEETETFYSYSSFTAPPTVYRYDFLTETSEVYRQPTVQFVPEDFVAEQVFYTSKDGTRVPMFIAYKKGLKRDGMAPTILYGYGGFNGTQMPFFSVTNVVWMSMGGVWAMPGIRGGGEYGEEWHLAGTKLRKQNVFDDFIAAAEWLIANKYTSTPKLAISGGSNGGLLVGACLVQRPDLFGAAMPAVGVMDMLRYQKFTIGWAWASDYGTSDDEAEFKALYAYSPVHNIKPGVKYPATFVTTGDHDDRVVPAHSYKFTAALQAGQAGDAPILIRIDTKAGHGGGKPTAKILDEIADKYAFLIKELGLDKLASHNL